MGALTLTAAERRAIEELIMKDGESEVCVRMQVSRQAFMRAFAGLPVRMGTVALIRAELARTPERIELDST